MMHSAPAARRLLACARRAAPNERHQRRDAARSCDCDLVFGAELREIVQRGRRLARVWRAAPDKRH
jgi:hypothetical protein